MSNIIGSPFDTFVKDQIDLRQQTLGKSKNIDYDALRYYTTKTPWLRLASSVNIEGETINGQKDGSVYWKLKEAGFTTAQILGDNLAKNFILFGGTTSAYDVSRKEDGETVTISKFYGENVGLNYGATLKNTGEATRAGSIGSRMKQNICEQVKSTRERTLLGRSPTEMDLPQRGGGRQRLLRSATSLFMRIAICLD